MAPARSSARFASLTCVAFSLLLLAGCPGEPAQEGALAPPPSSGQRWRFAQPAGVELVLAVESVGPRKVSYSAQTTIPDETPLAPLKLSYARLPGPTLPEGEDVELVAAGVRFACRRSEREGFVTYTARAGGREAFPGVLRVEREGKAVYALTAIEAK